MARTEGGTSPAERRKPPGRHRLRDLPSAQDFVPWKSDRILEVLPKEVTSEEVFQLLAQTPSRERRDLIGAANIHGGSAGGTGRFFEVGDRFLKTGLSRRYPSAESCLGAEGEAEQLRRALAIYHPARIWFLSRGRDGAFWACSLTPRLTILRQEFNRGYASVAPWALFLRGVEMALEATERAGIVLDCNPNNFGHDGEELYYLDDDLRSPPALLTQVLLRLREYPTAPAAVRTGFLAEFCARVCRYPLPVLDRLGLRADLETRLCWPRSAALQGCLEGLRERLP